MLTVSAHKEHSGGFDRVIKKRNVDDCRHTYSTWQCLLVSTAQPTPECLYHTFTSKTPCTLYIEGKSRYNRMEMKVVFFPCKTGNVSYIYIYR